jgi:hypothetical protein
LDQKGSYSPLDASESRLISTSADKLFSCHCISFDVLYESVAY